MDRKELFKEEDKDEDICDEFSDEYDESPRVATLTPAQAARYIPCNPYGLTLAARDPEKRAALGFPVFVMGNRVRIPKIPFFRFLGLIPEAGKAAGN